MQILLKPADSQRIYIEASGLIGEGTGVENAGKIAALFANLQADGQLYGQAIGHSGHIEALGVAEQQGRIYLVAKGERVDIAGNLTATAAEIMDAPSEPVYGEIRALGKEIYVTDLAILDVSNDHDGEVISLGYEINGGEVISLGYEINPGDERTKGIVAGSAVQLKLNALVDGNGGKILLWGTDVNFFASAASACGGPLGGDGGYIEASTKGILSPLGFGNTLAPKGKIGTLLYDPTDIAITAADLNIGTAYNASTNTISYTILNPSAATTINNTTLVTKGRWDGSPIHFLPR